MSFFQNHSKAHANKNTAPALPSQKQALPAAGMVPNNPYVNKKSIQAELQKLQSETEDFKKKAKEADEQTKRNQHLTAHGKQTSIELSDKIRVKGGELGALQHQYDMLKREEETLNKKLSEERQVLQELTAKEAEMEERAKVLRRDETKELETANDELEDELRRDETIHIIKMIHPETAAAVLLERFQQESEENLAKLGATLQEMYQAHVEHEAIKAKKEAQENQVRRMRRIVIETSKAKAANDSSAVVWTEEALVECEKEWEHELVANGTIPQPASFYSDDESRDFYTDNGAAEQVSNAQSSSFYSSADAGGDYDVEMGGVTEVVANGMNPLGQDEIRDYDSINDVAGDA